MFKIKNIQKSCPEHIQRACPERSRRAQCKLSRRGYTLLEVLVVLAVIILLTIFALPAYNSFRANQEMKQKASEIKELVLQAYNMAQNPEIGVADYVVVFDHVQNKTILARDMAIDAQASPRDWVLKPENFVREITLNENQIFRCQNSDRPSSNFCGILVCSVKPQEQQESACVLNDSMDSDLDMEDDLASTGLSVKVDDFNTNKYFYWSGLDERNRFEITGLEIKFNDIN